MILVTGGAGLLGNTLIEMLLARGETVKTIYHKTPLANFNSPAFFSEPCDILDVYALEDAMVGVTEIYHCAGLVSFNAGDENKLYKINAEGTANVVNAALNAGIRKMVHVSSVAAIGHMRPGEIINERMQWSAETGSSNYGRSKYLGEMEVWRGISEGLNAVIVNPAIILGPGDWNESSTKIFRTAYEEFPWYTEGSTGFADVRDTAEAMIQLMKSDVSEERFIISAENASWHSVFDRMADAFGKKRPSKKVTPFIAMLACRAETIKSIFTGRAPLLTKETAASAVANIEFDNSKLLKILPGFQYRSLGDTIHETCEALQQKINK